MIKPQFPGQLDAIEQHAQDAEAATKAIAELAQFAQYKIAVCLRALQLAVTADEALSKDEARQVYDSLTRAYFAEINSALEAVAHEVAASLAKYDPKPPADYTKPFRFSRTRT